MDGTNGKPDLRTILASLAQFAPPIQPTYNAGQANGTAPPASTSFIPATPSEPTLPPQPVAEKAQDPRIRPQSRSAAASPKPMIDPATITTWQEGLRCVTKIAAQNAQFAASIRRMIEHQRKHEMRWYAERQALKQTQASRANSTAKVQSILQSLSSTAGTASTDTEDGVGVDSEAELEAHDRKIYDAQHEMDTAMTAELKGLGVPFFGTDSALVVSEPDNASLGQMSNVHPKWSPKVTEAQLLELRRRMVGHLEDLYRD